MRKGEAREAAPRQIQKPRTSAAAALPPIAPPASPAPVPENAADLGPAVAQPAVGVNQRGILLRQAGGLTSSEESERRPLRAVQHQPVARCRASWPRRLTRQHTALVILCLGLWLAARSRLRCLEQQRQRAPLTHMHARRSAAPPPRPAPTSWLHVQVLALMLMKFFHRRRHCLEPFVQMTDAILAQALAPCTSTSSRSISSSCGDVAGCSTLSREAAREKGGGPGRDGHHRLYDGFERDSHVGRRATTADTLPRTSGVHCSVAGIVGAGLQRWPEPRLQACDAACGATPAGSDTAPGAEQLQRVAPRALRALAGCSCGGGGARAAMCGPAGWVGGWVGVGVGGWGGGGGAQVARGSGAAPAR